ncbi:unnamed protein product [Choristocarpus tenellus]
MESDGATMVSDGVAGGSIIPTVSQVEVHGTIVEVTGPGIITSIVTGGGGTVYNNTNLSVGRGGKLSISETSLMNITVGLLIEGAATLELLGMVTITMDLRVVNFSRLVLGDDISTAYGEDDTRSGLSVRSLVLEDGSTLWGGPGLNISCSGNMNICFNCSIDATGYGHNGASPGFNNASGSGAGDSGTLSGSGGGHGGLGLPGLQDVIAQRLEYYPYDTSDGRV